MNKFKSKLVALVLGLAAAGLLVTSLRLPLWHMRMEAPQYRGNEALKVFVLPGALGGSISEIKILNQYIGVTVPDTLPQTHWLPQVLVVGAALGVLIAFLPGRSRRFAGFGLAGLLCAALLFAAAQAQVQMYRIGHDRDPHAPLEGVAAFTPPLLGNRKVAQFELKSRLGLGSYAIAAALAFYITVGVLARKQTEPVRAGAPEPMEAAVTESTEVSV